jgi:hypothetical protein
VVRTEKAHAEAVVQLTQFRFEPVAPAAVLGLALYEHLERDVLWNLHAGPERDPSHLP